MCYSSFTPMTSPPIPTTFAMAPADVRANLYAHCQVTEPVLRGEPIYLCVCRRCHLVVAQVPRVAVDIEVGPVLGVLAHVDHCGKSPPIDILPP